MKSRNPFEVSEHDSARAVEGGGVAIIKSVEQHSPAEAHGRYTVKHLGPLEHERAEYVAVRDELQALKSRQATTQNFKRLLELSTERERLASSNFIQRLFGTRKISDVEKELAELQATNLQFQLRFGADIENLTNKLASFALEEKSAPDYADNVVTTVGKNLALDTYLAGSAYTVTGPYMGLIGAVSYGAGPVVGDTMASHGGWTEAGTTNAPTYTSPRKTCAWSAASSGSKALSAALTFAITGTGTAKGCFIVYGSGAVTTIDNTSGTLYSAGLFTGGDKAVTNGDSLAVSYSTSL